MIDTASTLYLARSTVHAATEDGFIPLFLAGTHQIVPSNTITKMEAKAITEVSMLPPQTTVWRSMSHFCSQCSRSSAKSVHEFPLMQSTVSKVVL